MTRALRMLVVVSLCFGCSASEPEAGTGGTVPSAHQPLLDEVNQARLWFRAKKTRPIWAKRLDRDERIRTLEGVEQVPAGTWLCRGEAGELWPQTEQRLHDKYIATEVDADGWRKYEPHPDAQGVMAAEIGHPFQVEAKWGTLTGKPGDYLVKNYEDRDVPHPDDVWIVDQKLFEATYAATEAEQVDESSSRPEPP